MLVEQGSFIDILGLLSGVFAQVWYIIPLLLFVSIFKSRWFKGMFGKFLVNRLLSQLPESDYTLVLNGPFEADSGQSIIVNR
jgi:hypothetical protein